MSVAGAPDPARRSMLGRLMASPARVSVSSSEVGLLGVVDSWSAADASGAAFLFPVRTAPLVAADVVRLPDAGALAVCTAASDGWPAFERSAGGTRSLETTDGGSVMEFHGQALVSVSPRGVACLRGYRYFGRYDESMEAVLDASGTRGILVEKPSNKRETGAARALVCEP
jgi:hypothetical protein